MIKLTEKRLQWLSEQYPDTMVAMGYISGVKSWRKYGKNSNVGITSLPETVWQGDGLYPFQSSSYTAEVLSASVADTVVGTGAQVVRILGLDASFLEVTEDVPLNGVTPVLTTRTDWIRIYRAYILTAGSGEVNAGDITIRLVSAGATQAVIAAGMGQTQQAAMTLPANYNGAITSWSIHLLNTSATTEIEFGIFIRDGSLDNPSWRVQSDLGAKSGASSSVLEAPINAPIPIGPKTDVDVRVLACNSNNVRVASIFEMMGFTTTLSTPPSAP